MKVLVILVVLIFLGCEKAGTVYDQGTGYVNGHKIKVVRYFYDDNDDYVLLAFIDDTLNSLTYPVGKTQQTVIQIRGRVMLENDSIAIIRKEVK